MFYTLIEQAELRNKLIDRVDVLNKVKELFLIPKLEMMSSQMVADFYEVDAVTLRKCYTRNKDEITSDSAITMSTGDLKRKGHNATITQKSE